MFQQVMLMAHPVGSIYESTDATSPADLFGGTWEAMNPGRVLVSAGTASTGTVYTAGATGGEESHKQSEEELVPHSHTFITAPILFADIDTNYNDVINPQTKEGACKGDIRQTTSTGGGKPFNIMQPYEVVYRWKRTA